jgi:hypothetical protein
MKKIVMLLLALLCILALVGCSSVISGTEGLIEKAREELPVSDADTIDLNYAGLCEKDDSALIWFVSGNEYQAHYYLPMECDVVGKDEYTFVRTYTPIERGVDIVVLEWKSGYSFLINNPNCVAVKITDNAGTREIPIAKGAYPYVFYNKLLPSEYVFLGKDGNELP